MSFAFLRRHMLQGHGRVVLLGAGYFLVAAFTVRYTRFDGGVAFVWAATALLLAELTITSPAQWLPRLAVCGLAGMTATALFGLGPAIAFPLTAVNIAEAAGGAWLLRRFCPAIGEFRSLVEVGVFIAIAGIILPAATAFFGALCASAVTNTGYWPNWLNWYAAHALGTIIFAPLLILCLRGEPASLARATGRRGVVTAVALLTVLALTTALVFSQTRLPLLFLPFLPMMIVVFRLGRFGAVTSSAIVALIATALTLHGFGPIGLVDGAIGLRAQFLQFYLAVAVLMVLPAAAELKHRKNLFAELQETSALQHLILDRTSDIIMRLELDGTIAYVSPSVGRLGGYAPDQLIGRKPHDLIYADDVGAVVQVHRQALASPNETFIVEYRAIRDDGGLGWFETHTRATVNEANQPTGAVSIIREISKRKHAEAELEHLASSDPLTGLANRRTFDAALHERMERIGENPAPVCVALFDLDWFKAINDRFGHAAGDDVLKRFAGMLGSTVRGTDLAARYGGEEFVVMLPGASIEQAAAVCERVRVGFEKLTLHAGDGRRIPATVSVGLAWVRPGDTPESVLAAADAALYRAKNDGRNQLAMAA